ncbi:hypothetical protein [Kitasatospora sp. NPDC047058]
MIHGERRSGWSTDIAIEGADDHELDRVLAGLGLAQEGDADGVE